jgi:hypothetical protein
MSQNQVDPLALANFSDELEVDSASAPRDLLKRSRWGGTLALIFGGCWSLPASTWPAFRGLFCYFCWGI